MKKTPIYLLLSLLLFQFFAGCVPPTSPGALPTVNATVTSENTPLPVTATVPVFTSTPLSIKTVTPTKIPTATPLTLQDANKVIMDLYKDNGSCQLPCFWKIIPGETLWTDVSEFLTSTRGEILKFGTRRIPRYDISFENLDCPVCGISPGIWVENGLVKAIGINSRWVAQDFDYSLSGLLRYLGEPDEIWISPIAESLDGQPYHYLKLFYPSKGILVGMLGNAEQDGQYLSVCPQNIFSRSPYPPTLLLWNPKEQVSFDGNFGKQLVDDDLGIIADEYRLLQDVSSNGLTNAQFYDIYSDPDTEICIKVSPVR
jgi:hypothetical protein